MKISLPNPQDPNARAELLQFLDEELKSLLAPESPCALAAKLSLPQNGYQPRMLEVLGMAIGGYAYDHSYPNREVQSVLTAWIGKHHANSNHFIFMNDGSTLSMKVRPGLTETNSYLSSWEGGLRLFANALNQHILGILEEFKMKADVVQGLQAKLIP